LGELAKAVPIAVTHMASIDRAISSAGGVAWSEVDENFQLGKLPGTYVVGEMLDWEAPTGGYLLQAVLSTARAAAAGAVSDAAGKGYDRSPSDRPRRLDG
jgi:predicted flavoprotein YhiN